MARRRARTEAAIPELLAAAIELVGESGIGAVTVRALAQRTHYSPSTVGYHTVPFDAFVDRVWRKVGIDLATDVLGDAQGDEWATPAADRMLRWSDEHPSLAAFFVTHGAKPPADYGVDEWSFLEGMGDALPADRTLAVLSYLARRFQLALEHALRWPGDRSAQVEVLATELRAIEAEWRRFVDSAAATQATQASGVSE